MMRMKYLGAAAGAIAVSFAAVGAASAHHSFGAEFDINAPVTLEGEVVRFDWTNPHSWLYINIVNDAGETEEWRVEGGAPSALLRRGWNRNSLPAGTKVKVEGFRSRDGGLRASASDIVFPDGRELSLGNPTTEAAAAQAAARGD